MRPLPGIWRALRSRTLAAVLLAVLVTLCVAGAVVPQKGRRSYGEWRRDNPRLAAAADYLGLNDVYGSSSFVVTLAAIALSTAVCSVSRLASWRYDGSALRRRGTSHGAPRRSCGDKVVSPAADGIATVLLARRGIVGSLVFHAGLLVTLAGGTVSALTRARGRIIATEGESVPVRQPGATDPARGPAGDAHGPELFRVRLDRFHPVLRTRWGPPDYASDVTVIDDGRERKKATIRVNEPLSYGGLVFYQDVHGFSPQFALSDSSGRTLFRRYVSLRTDLDADPARYVDTFPVIGTGLEVDAEFFPDAVVEGGALRTESPVPRRPAAFVTVRRGQDRGFSGPLLADRPVDIGGGYRFALTGVRYWSALDMVRDRGAFVVFVGSWIAIGGLCVRLVGGHSRRRSTDDTRRT